MAFQDAFASVFAGVCDDMDIGDMPQAVQDKSITYYILMIAYDSVAACIRLCCVVTCMLVSTRLPEIQVEEIQEMDDATQKQHMNAPP